MDRGKDLVAYIKKHVQEEVEDWNGSWELPGKLNELFDSYYEGYRIVEHVTYMPDGNIDFVEGVYMTWLDLMLARDNPLFSENHFFLAYSKYNGVNADVSRLNEYAQNTYRTMPRRYWEEV